MRRSEQVKLIESVNAIEVSEGKDYGWLWEYSKFRFSQSSSSVKAAEDKAASLLKFTLSLSGALWLVFTYLLREFKPAPEVAFNPWLISGLLLLFGAFACSVFALIPTKRLRPFREQIAMRFIRDNEKDSSRPLGRFALGLMMCSDFHDRAITRTSYLVIWGTGMLMLAICTFIVGFYSYQTQSPNLDHQYRTSYYRYRWEEPCRFVPSADLADHCLDHLSPFS
jgi:hypothetical protein